MTQVQSCGGIGEHENISRHNALQRKKEIATGEKESFCAAKCVSCMARPGRVPRDVRFRKACGSFPCV